MTNNQTQPKIKTAEEAITELEELELGRDFTKTAQAATAAVDSLREESAIGMFPVSLAPVSDAALRDFQIATELMNRNSHAELVELHGQTLAGDYEELASVVRGVRGRRLVELAARRRATPLHERETHANAEKREVPKAVRCFQRTIAEQFFEHKQFMPASEILSVVIPELEGRLEAALTRHEEHYREKAEEAAAALAHRRDELAQRFRALRNHGYDFVIPGVSKADRFDRLRRYGASEVSRYIIDGKCDDVFAELEKQLVGAERAIGIEATPA